MVDPADREQEISSRPQAQVANLRERTMSTLTTAAP
jgi:hypothetical protein